MKINTDSVKQKQFVSPIDARNLKLSQEYRALATMRYLYPTEYDGMIKGESPDFQDSEKSMGVEVTSAVSECDMKASRAFSELHQSNPKDTKKQRIIESCGYSTLPLHGKSVAITTTGTSDREKQVFQKTIKRKAAKLQQYQKKHKRMGLAIILPEISTSNAENHFSEWIKEVTKETDHCFDFFFVISCRFCTYYDSRNDRTETHSLTIEESRCLSTIGRMTAVGELSLSDTEWL